MQCKGFIKEKRNNFSSSLFICLNNVVVLFGFTKRKKKSVQISERNIIQKNKYFNFFLLKQPLSNKHTVLVLILTTTTATCSLSR